MSRELNISYQGAGASLYAIVRRISDGYVWNGSAFVAWANGDIANYDLPLTDRGGDLYDADFPSSAGAADYRIIFYEQAGGAPALTDLILATRERYWNGATLETTSDVTLSAYALTTLESVKRRLGLEDDSSYDTILTETINHVSALIERVAGRWFKARDVRERYDGIRQKRLVLRHGPVQHINRISYGWANALTVTYSGSAIRANVSVYHDPNGLGGTASGVRLVSYSSAGTRTANNLLFTDYPSISSLVTAINAISGWSASAYVNAPSADLNPVVYEDVVNDSRATTVTLTYPDQTIIDYTVNYETGTIEAAWDRVWLWLSRDAAKYATSPNANPNTFPMGNQSLCVEYRAGYETIPDDVVLLANRIVQDYYHESEIGSGVTEVKLGPAMLKLDRAMEDLVKTQLGYYTNWSGSVC